MVPGNDGPDFETITAERSRIGGGVLGSDEVPADPRTTVIESSEQAEEIDASASTEEAAVEEFLSDTDFERASLMAIEIPVSETQCYTVAVESITLTDGQTTVRATVERERPECLDAPTVLTCFVRIDRPSVPSTVALELDERK